MSEKQINRWIIIGHVLVAILQATPWLLPDMNRRGLDALGISAAISFWVVIIDFILAVFLTVVPFWPSLYRHKGAWWIGFGVFILLFIPGCMATASLHHMMYPT